jgi:hypothetical protein
MENILFKILAAGLSGKPFFNLLRQVNKKYANDNDP